MSGGGSGSELWGAPLFGPFLGLSCALCVIMVVRCGSSKLALLHRRVSRRRYCSLKQVCWRLRDKCRRLKTELRRARAEVKLIQRVSEKSVSSFSRLGMGASVSVCEGSRPAVVEHQRSCSRVSSAVRPVVPLRGSVLREAMAAAERFRPSTPPGIISD